MVTKLRSTYTGEYFPTITQTLQTPLLPADVTSNSTYLVRDEFHYTTSCLFFTQDMHTQESIVMKALSHYKDTRYDLETISKRQQCQLVALHQNRAITPGVYIGLGHIKEYTAKYIVLDQVFENPGKDLLDANADYLLLMRELPRNRRLDNLLASTNQPGKYIQPLIKRIMQMHENMNSSPLSDENGMIWGSCEQLHRKLRHNLAFFEQLLLNVSNTDYYWDDWVRNTLSRLREVLPQVFSSSIYQHYFAQRLQEKRIKHCHGDLKVRHVWITSDGQQCTNGDIQIIDSVDFNPTYCYIDILSDFAMLAVDIQAQTKSANLANEMIECYLHISNQKSETCKAILDYYLVEKAIVGATISILYDGELERGIQLLSIAESRCASVQDRLLNSVD